MAQSSDVGYAFVVIVDPSFGQVAIVVPSNAIRLTFPRGLVIMASLIVGYVVVVVVAPVS